MHRQRESDSIARRRAAFGQRNVAFARRTTLAVLALFIVGCIASSLHMALERHAVCPDHGELVHVSPAADAPACESPEHETHGALWTTAPALSGDDGHDHCSIAAQARERDVAWTPVRVVVQKDCTLLAHACVPGPSRVPAFSRLFLAPKHSPPV